MTAPAEIKCSPADAAGNQIVQWKVHNVWASCTVAPADNLTATACEVAPRDVDLANFIRAFCDAITAARNGIGGVVIAPPHPAPGLSP